MERYPVFFVGGRAGARLRRVQQCSLLTQANPVVPPPIHVGGRPGARLRPGRATFPVDSANPVVPPPIPPLSRAYESLVKAEKVNS